MFKSNNWKPMLAAAMVVALFAGSAAAEKFSFGARAVEVPLPAGFCKVEETGADAALRKGIAPALSSESRLLIAFIECESLAMLRKDPGYAEPVAFGLVVLVQKDGQPAPMKHTRQSLFRGEAGLAPERFQVRKKVEAWMKTEGLPNGSTREEVGIADTDLNAIYTLATVAVKARSGTQPKLIVQTMSFTVVNGLGLLVTMNDPVGPRTTIAGILGEQKRNLAALVATNEP